MTETEMDRDDVTRLVPTEAISLDEPPEGKDACIEFLLDLAVEAGRVEDRETALDALLAREEETTTGVGKGIAIPHAQTDAVTRPSVAFARSAAGVDFDSMDGEPAHLLFAILAPAGGSDDHLAILSALSRSLMHEEVREGLYEADSPADVQAVLAEAMT
ncbi:PTS sugar transporter subunit IIA [Halomarina pelagica]|uniref:PTS sugar transporter subunit IIA n=1 Tax=Halomarina pelagica TaxID=2961599 RepID=UPI0026E56F2F|nr:fructose PTS transporter subunit IIA [Halomarina sp. BND7]